MVPPSRRRRRCPPEATDYIGDAADVVVVPMGAQYLVNRFHAVRSHSLGEQRAIFRPALPGVDQNAAAAGSHQIGLACGVVKRAIWGARCHCRAVSAIYVQLERATSVGTSQCEGAGIEPQYADYERREHLEAREGAKRHARFGQVRR